MCRSDLHTKIGEKAREEKRLVYVGFIDLENAHNRVNREVLWQVLRMYDVGGKLLSEIKSTYDDSSACVRVKWGESEQFKIVGETRVYHVNLAFQWIYGRSDGGEN